ncbi:MAG: hypothetical protein IJF51_04595, partial [Clostridia bacterium]|nr:hypothetical protein [Clostridia bacterium]
PLIFIDPELAWYEIFPHPMLKCKNPVARVWEFRLLKEIYWQEHIKDDCPEEYFTIIMRRCMMRVSEAIARQQKCGALITGESLGQVASQTMNALQCTDAVAHLPIFRPAIGMDKTEIVELSRKIGTFETSIEPYEDCCTVFTPKHPRLRPTLEEVEKAEQGLTDLDAMVARAAEGARLVVIDPGAY